MKSMFIVTSPSDCSYHTGAYRRLRGVSIQLSISHQLLYASGNALA